MRVLVVADHFPPASGGLAVQADRLALELSARGHGTMVVAAAPRTEVESRGGVEIRLQRASFARLPIYQEGSPPFHPPWPDFEFVAAVRDAVRTFRPDVVHVHGWSVFSVAALGDHTPPVVATLHDYGMICPKKSLMRHGAICPTARGLLPCATCDSAAQPTPRRVALAGTLEAGGGWVDRRVSRWLAVSEYVADRQRARLGPTHRVDVVPPLVDLPPERPPAPGRNPPYVLYVGPGPENPDKGRAVLLEAFERLAEPGFALVLVGGREPVEGPGVEDRGYLKGAELETAYRDATFSVIPSVWPDPCPAVAVEALGWGRPVVASAAGGLASIVRAEETGVLVEPGDVDALAAGLRRLMREPETRARMGVAARPSVEHFAVDAVVPRLLDVYAEVAR